MVVEKKVQITYLGPRSEGREGSEGSDGGYGGGDAACEPAHGTAAEVTTTLLPMLDTADADSRSVINNLIKRGDWNALRSIVEEQFCPKCVIRDAEVVRQSKSNFINLADCRTANVRIAIPAMTIHAAVQQALQTVSGGNAHNLEAVYANGQAQAAATAAVDCIFKEVTVACFYAVYTILGVCPHANEPSDGRVRPVAVVLTSNGGMDETTNEGYLDFEVAIPQHFCVEDEIQLAASIGANKAQIGSTSAQSVSEFTWKSDLVAFTI